MAVTIFRRINAGTVLHRIHRLAHDPIFFGPMGSAPECRFDSPDGTYKVLYAARSLQTAFGETLVRSPHVSFVTSTAVAARARSELLVKRTLRLYPLIDAAISSQGLSFTDLHGDAYGKTWKVSAKIHQSTAADGILYTSRFDNQRCIALFDRASDALAETLIKAAAISPAEAKELAAHFGKDYVEP